MKRILTKINNVLYGYVKGIGILCVVIGFASSVGLYFLGVKYFLILGIIAGVCEAIPFIGPWIGAVPAIVIAALVSPALAVQVAVLYSILQWTENHLLAPKVLGDQLALHPAVIIIAILILGKLAGAWGLFFAAPIVAIFRIIYEEIQEG
jgi:predicted PurR-regulated permease PerM